MQIANYQIGVPVIDHPTISIALISIASIQWVVKAQVITPALVSKYHVIYQGFTHLYRKIQIFASLLTNVINKTNILFM